VKHPEGFTVIEVMVASMILVLLLGTAFLVLESSVGSWLRSEQRLDERQNVRIALDRIIREVREARQLVAVDEDIFVEFKDQENRIIRYSYDVFDGQIARYVDGAGGTIVSYTITGVSFRFLADNRVLSVVIESGNYRLESKAAIRQLY